LFPGYSRIIRSLFTGHWRLST